MLRTGHSISSSRLPDSVRLPQPVGRICCRPPLTYVANYGDSRLAPRDAIRTPLFQSTICQGIPAAAGREWTYHQPNRFRKNQENNGGCGPFPPSRQRGWVSLRCGRLRCSVKSRPPMSILTGLPSLAGKYFEVTNPKTEKSRRPLTRTFLIPHSPKNSKTGGNPATDPNLLSRPN